MPLLKLSNKSIHYTDHAADGQSHAPTYPLVMIHGLGLSENFYYPILQSLRQFRRISFDTYGAGRSPYIDSVKPSVPSLASDVVEALDLLKLDTIIIIGHSMGAIVAAHLAATESARIAGFVGLGPAVPNPDSVDMFEQRIQKVEAEGMEAVANTIPEMAAGPNSTSLQRAFIRESLMSQDVKGYIELCRVLAYAERPDYGAIKAPTLLVTGSEDKSAPPDRCQIIQRSVQSSVKILEILDGKGHFLCLEDPKTVGLLITNFCT